MVMKMKKIKVKDLKALVKTLVESKFQSTVERLMTLDEVSELAHELQLAPEVIEFIKDKFVTAYDLVDSGEFDENDISREEGRLGLYMEWQEILEELAEIMNLPSDSPVVDKVFSAFFAE
jgi:hypothetical protein